MKHQGVDVFDNDMKGMHKRVRRSVKEVAHNTILHDGELSLGAQVPQGIFDEAARAVHSRAASSSAQSKGISFTTAIAPKPLPASASVAENKDLVSCVKKILCLGMQK